MEQLKAQLNTWLDSIGRENLIKWVAIWFAISAVIYGLFGSCGTAFSLIFGGGMAAFGSSAAGAAAGAVMWTLLISVVGVASAVIHGVAAFGLFRRMSWGRTLTLVALGFGVAYGVLNFPSGIISLIIDGVLLYIFLTDEGVKAILSN